MFCTLLTVLPCMFYSPFYFTFCSGQAIKSFNFFLFQNTEVVVSGDVHLFGYRFLVFLAIVINISHVSCCRWKTVASEADNSLET